ncbi:MAG: hypothetical protein HY826_08045 [Actinobacteria bacterium]|nr:hypothetical protein [Actinomycetota bacterium]
MLVDADEFRHEASEVEAWWWWGRSPDSGTGVFVGLELRGRRFDYWAGLVRTDEPYLYLEELDGTGLRQGLEIKPPEMWADHQCDVPFRQWSLANEAHGVLIDDPLDVLQRPYGIPTPTTFDIEWYSTVEPTALSSGYEQCGEVDARIELANGAISCCGPGHRLHVWGDSCSPLPVAIVAGGRRLLAPYRRPNAPGVVQVLTDRGWFVASGGL